MDNWEKCSETSLPQKEDFYSYLNMEHISADCKHVKRVLKDFEIKDFGEYHGLYVCSDTLLIVDVFENFWNKCLEICELDTSHFCITPGLAWQAVKLELLTDTDTMSVVKTSY